MATQNQVIAQPKGEDSSSWWGTYRFGRGVAWGTLILYSAAAFMGSFGSELGRLVGLVAWIAALFAAIIVHELGHAIAANLVGWRLIVFAAGPIGFQFHNHDFAIIRRARRAEAEGFVLAVPASAAIWTRIRYAAIVAAGPAASLILTALAIVAAHSWSPEPDVDWPEVMIGFACLSAAIVLSTLTPSTRPRGQSDIQNFIRTLRRTDSDWARERAIGWLFGMTKNKVRLRELPSWMVEEARVESIAAGGDLKRAYDSLIIGIVLDSTAVDKVQARRLLDEFRDKHGGSAWLDSCDAYFTAVWEGDADRARERLWRGEDAEDGMEPMLRAADAAVYARAGDAGTARVLLAQMRNAVRKQSSFPDPTFRDIGRQIEAFLPA